MSPIAPAFFGAETANLSSRQDIILETPVQKQSMMEKSSQKLGHRSTGSMEIFADIALSMQSRPQDETNSMTTKRPIRVLDHDLPPSKRARSEKLPSPEMSRNQITRVTRPATSHEQTPQSRMMEAELLLNFSQIARQAYPSSNATKSQYARQASRIHHQPTPELSSPSPSRPHFEKASNSTGILQECEEEDLKKPVQAGGRNDNSMASPSQGHASLGLDTPVVGAWTLNATDSKIFDGPKNLQNGVAVEQSRGALTDRGDARSFVPDTESKDLNPLPRYCEPAASAQEEICNNESSVAHGTLGSGLDIGGNSTVTTSNAVSSRARSVGECASRANGSPMVTLENGSTSSIDISESEKFRSAAVCAACKFQRNSSSIEGDNHATSWINCDGCKSWFHFACAGFKNEREVRAVDKFRCKKCKPVHGATTYVRKSSRAHSAIDYAGLHQGVIKTSDERMEHHYIQPIKDGIITFLPESFARMRPELVTAEFFEKSGGMKEPVVIPAILNPRPNKYPMADPMEDFHAPHSGEPSGVEDSFGGDIENQVVPDEGQDALDMVIPQGLTVRQVAELYGPEEKVEVIDVKSQNGENKKWNMRRWVEYYENPNNKVVRNVISLEVSQSKLGRLIRRPKIVRDLDLQDSVWPEDLVARGEFPRVQFYCLMSVADCFTDFHIDFGGSSVFYHILKGKKTFLFIPPKEKHLKKYEEWCMSPAQNWTFLADQTKECYRVDLSEGDTMLIPSGWIHAVWTPEDSLVIGGNFLTRMNFGMQLRIAQVEKATGVARKFRYPQFQKLHWYTAFRYMENDPLPDDLKDEFYRGQMFPRDKPVYHEFDAWGENSRAGKRNYNSRYYSQGEIEGLRDLTTYLLRTVLIDLGKITEGITAETRNAVRKSIPRGHGDPLEAIKNFAAWCAWKRGNEVLHHWAYPDSKLEDSLPPEKLSTVTLKKLDREAALEAALQAPRRQSVRRRSLQGASPVLSSGEPSHSLILDPPTLPNPKRPAGDSFAFDRGTMTLSGEVNNNRGAPSGAGGSNRKTACEACRKRRRACKHKNQVEAHSQSGISHEPTSTKGSNQARNVSLGAAYTASDLDVNADMVAVPQASSTGQHNDWSHPRSQRKESPSDRTDGAGVPEQVHGFELVSRNIGLSRPRTKACNECRKSKVCPSSGPISPFHCLLMKQRRCVHDAFGNEDPVKVAEQAIPRPHARKNHKTIDSQAMTRFSADEPRRLQESPKMMAPVANMIAAPQEIAEQHIPVPDKVQDRQISSIGHALVNTNALVCSISMPAPIPEDYNFAKPDTIKDEPCDGRERKKDESSTTEGAAADEPSASSAEQPLPSSSLISPPASSNDDLGSSPINGSATYSPSPSPSRQLPHQALKEVHRRYTPESGTLRRASSSSFEQQRNDSGLDKVHELSLAAPTQDIGANSSVLADSESLRLVCISPP